MERQSVSSDGDEADYPVIEAESADVYFPCAREGDLEGPGRTLPEAILRRLSDD